MGRHTPVVLSQPDRAYFEQAGGSKWIGHRLMFGGGPEERYWQTLDTFTEQLASLGLAPHDPEVLQRLMAVVLANDESFGIWFRSHNADVANPGSFARLCHVAAGALVEAYLRGPEPERDETAQRERRTREGCAADTRAATSRRFVKTRPEWLVRLRATRMRSHPRAR